jgi:transcriptional regulator with XRE-family HTH domain
MKKAARRDNARGRREGRVTTMRIDPTKIDLALARAGLRWHELAKKTGIAPATLTAAKQGRNTSGRTVIKIANALGVEPETLLQEERR